MIKGEFVERLEIRSRTAILIGYPEQSKAYKLLDVDTKKVVASRDVPFDESSEQLTPFEIQNPVPHNTKVDGNGVSICLDDEKSSHEIYGNIETAEQKVQEGLPSQNCKLEDVL